jgi:hypothetical protein
VILYGGLLKRTSLAGICLYIDYKIIDNVTKCFNGLYGQKFCYCL